MSVTSPASAIEYHYLIAKKKPFVSHEFYRKRILDVSPQHVEFEIHNSEFKSLVKNGVASCGGCKLLAAY